MLCRAVFTAIAVSYVLCVLLLSGLQKEDIDVNTLKKLERYNVNIHDLDNESLRKECLIKANLSKGNNTQQSQIPAMNNSYALDMADTSTLGPVIIMDYFNSKDPGKNINIQTEKSDTKHLKLEIDNTKTSGMTTLKEVPKDISGMYINKEISQTNYINKEIRNINLDPNQPTLESVLRFWNTITRNKLSTEVPTTTRHSFVHSKEMEYINRILEEHLATRSIHSTTESPKQINIDRNVMENNAFMLESQLLKKYLIPLSHNVEAILKTVNTSNNQLIFTSKSMPPVFNEPTVKDDNSNLKPTHESPGSNNKRELDSESSKPVSPLINTMKDTDFFPENKIQNLPNRDTGDESILNNNYYMEKSKPSLTNNENLEDWYSNFFRNNMATSANSRDAMAKSQFPANSFYRNYQNSQQGLFVSKSPMYMDDLFINKYPPYFLNNEPNNGHLIDVYWLKNNKILEKPKDILKIKTDYYGLTSKPQSKDNYEEDASELIRTGNVIYNPTKSGSFGNKDLKSNDLGSILTKETFKSPLMSYGKEINSLSFMGSHFYEKSKFHFNELYGTNYPENPKDEPNILKDTMLSDNTKNELHETNTEKVINEPLLGFNLPNNADKIIWRTKETPLMNDIPKKIITDYLTKQYSLFHQNIPVTKFETTVDKTVETSAVRNDPIFNLKSMTDKDKVIIMANSLQYINDILRMDQGLKMDKLTHKQNGYFNNSATNSPKENYTTKTSKPHQTIQPNFQIDAEKVNKTLPMDWVKEIAESVKNMVLKDIRQMATTTIETTITPMSSTTVSTKPTSETTSITTTVTSTTTEKHEIKKAQDADYVLQKLMDLIQGFKSSTERGTPNALFPSVTRQEYRTPENIHHRPTYSPIILKHHLEIISPPFVNSNYHHPVVNYLPNIDNFQLQSLKNNMQQPHLLVRSTNEFPKPPITLQTNLYEIAPLGVPIEKPLMPFNQIIVVTTKVPYERNKKLENKRNQHKLNRTIINNDSKNKRSKVHHLLTTLDNNGRNQDHQQIGLDGLYKNHKDSSQSKVDEAEKVHNPLMSRDKDDDVQNKYQQPFVLDDLHRNHRDRTQSKVDDSTNYRDGSQDNIDLTKKLRISDNVRHHGFNEPSYMNRTMRYRERSHYYDINENEPDKGFRFHSKFRQPRPPHEMKKFHERLERIEDWPESESKDKNQSPRYGSEVASRQQVPFNNMKRHKKFDDTHFKNFLKTQQKVNEMLERILATKPTTERPDSVEIL